MHFDLTKHCLTMIDDLLVSISSDQLGPTAANLKWIDATDRPCERLQAIAGSQAGKRAGRQAVSQAGRWVGGVCHCRRGCAF